MTVDATLPVAKAPVEAPAPDAQLASATVPGTIPIRLAWSGTDNMTAAGQLAYELQQSTNGGAWTAIKLPKATATSVVRQLAPGTSTYGFRVRARDRAGNWSGWAQGESFTVSAYQETAPEIAYTGTWTTQGRR